MKFRWHVRSLNKVQKSATRGSRCFLKLKVLIYATGGRGDVQPFVALGSKLASAGHEPVLAVYPKAALFVESYGLQYFTIGDKRGSISQSGTDVLPGRLSHIKKSKDRMIRRFRARRGVSFVLEDMTSAVAWNVDLVVHHAFLPGHVVAECIGVPHIPVCLVPCWIPTKSFANPWRPSLPAKFNRTSYFRSPPRMSSIQSTYKWRRDFLGLSWRRGHRDILRNSTGAQTHVFQPISTEVLPSPLDYHDRIHTTGFWFLPAITHRTPPAHLHNFLATGEVTICISFGSAVGNDPVGTAHLVTEAVRRARVRAVVVGGSRAISPEELGPSFLYIEQVSFDWLLPKVAAVIHHGGIGTAAMALAAGCPQVVCSFHLGHQFTGERMHATGVAPAPIPQSQLSAEGLATAIRLATTDSEMSERSRKVAFQICKEDGVSDAVRILESIV